MAITLDGINGINSTLEAKVAALEAL